MLEKQKAKIRMHVMPG